MLFTECRVGMEVVFGRGNGEYTRGIVEKMNRIKAKVRTNENRGRTTAGTIWSVPYSLMSPASEGSTPTQIAIHYSIFQNRVEQMILEAINAVYNELSPENLCCDGELPMNQVAAKRTLLNRQLNGLFQALGRTVDENTVYEWWKEKQDFQRKRSEQNPK